MTRRWNASIEYDGAITDDQGVELVGRDADFPIVTVNRDAGRTRVSIGVEASTLRKAVDEAWRQARALTDGIVTGEPVSIRVVSDEQLAEELLNPPLPALVDSAGAREILGVTTQPQMYQLERRPDFPAPVAELSGGRRVYVRAAVEAFGSTWERKPGRPRKTSTE